MFLVLPFVSGEIRAKLPEALRVVCDAISVAPVPSDVHGAWVRQHAYLPTALLWLGAAVPLLFFARLPRPSSLSKKFSSSSSSSSCPSSPLRHVLAPLRSLPSTPSLLWFL